jgi:hypothetical protein
MTRGVEDIVREWWRSLPWDGKCTITGSDQVRLIGELREHLTRLETVATRAAHLVEDAYSTEDGQAMIVDPGFWRALREALGDL